MEIAPDTPVPGVVPIRDSKNPDGPVLVVNRTTWASFVTGIRSLP
ncbi:DUF397 domain-containing protein [Streptomyces sp. NPDC002643]